LRGEDTLSALHLEPPLEDVIHLIISGVNVEGDTLPGCESLLEGAIRASRARARDATKQAVPKVSAFPTADNYRIHRVSCCSLCLEQTAPITKLTCRAAR